MFMGLDMLMAFEHGVLIWIMFKEIASLEDSSLIASCWVSWFGGISSNTKIFIQFSKLLGSRCGTYQGRLVFVDEVPMLGPGLGSS